MVFAAAVVFFFFFPPWERTDRGESANLETEQAKLPVIYPKMGTRTMAPLFGHDEELAVTAERDSLLVLPENRELAVTVDVAWEVKSLGYEIRSLDMSRLIERTELTGWRKQDGRIDARLPIQNLLEEGRKYVLGINVGLSDGRTFWYYSRILEDREISGATGDASGGGTENSESPDGAESPEAPAGNEPAYNNLGYLGEMIALAEDFSAKTYDYNAAQDLAMYMESDAGADNSSFGVVTLKNSFTQLTWGNLGARREGAAYTKLLELEGNLAVIQIISNAVRESDGSHYSVRENFTMRWTGQRIYIMDYEREVNQLFTDGGKAVSGKRIVLGIEDGRDLYAKKNADGTMTAFVVGRELWAYNGDLIHVFSFGDYGADNINACGDGHGIEILDVGEDGGIDFLVYGYMVSGAHEGRTGISFYRYKAGDNSLEELFFLPVAECYGLLRGDVELLSHKGANGILYLYLRGSVYGIDLTSLEYVVVASGLSGDSFAASGDGTRIAWQEEAGRLGSGILNIMDLDSGERAQVGADDPEVYRVLGFIGDDCVYGAGDAGDYVTSNGRQLGLYLKRLEIVDKNMDTVMRYEKPLTYIREVSVEGSRIHVRTVTDRGGGIFAPSEDDTIVCNTEALPGRMDDIGWYADETEGKVYFVQLSGSARTGAAVRLTAPETISRDSVRTINIEPPAKAESMEFYAYGRGRCLGRYLTFAGAARAAYDEMGFVTDGDGGMVWARANKESAHTIKNITEASMRMERALESFTPNGLTEEGSLMLDLGGCRLEEALYFVSADVPVLIFTGEGSRLYISGYSRSEVYTYNPVSGEHAAMAMEDAQEYFETLGNWFACCLPAYKQG